MLMTSRPRVRRRGCSARIGRKRRRRRRASRNITRSRNISRARCIRCTATRAAAALRLSLQYRSYQQPQYQDEQQYAEAEQQPQDPSRYDDALYGQIESGQDYQRDPAYPDDPYAYQNGYEEEPEEPRKRGGLFTVVAVLALAVLGTGARVCLSHFVGSPRSGEPPIIKADNSPTKVDAGGWRRRGRRRRTGWRLGDGAEKLVPREETPVDVNAAPARAWCFRR